MEALTCRLVPYAEADGPTNMAADEVLVRSAQDRGPALRLYGWSTATLSLGYFQRAAVRLSDPRLAVLPWVRRPSGGATLVHHHELTYALAVPPALVGRHAEWMPRMHGVIARALESLGVSVVAVESAAAERHGDVLCFQQFTPGDLLCRGKKVVGSAQRKVHHALLQHGSILLRQSEHSPQLPGIEELTAVSLETRELGEALLQEFRAATGSTLSTAAQDEADVDALKREKYATPGWNERR